MSFSGFTGPSPATWTASSRPSGKPAPPSPGSSSSTASASSSTIETRLVVVYARARDVARALAPDRRPLVRLRRVLRLLRPDVRARVERRLRRLLRRPGLPPEAVRAVLEGRAARLGLDRLPPWWRYADPRTGGLGAVVDAPEEYALRARRPDRRALAPAAPSPLPEDLRAAVRARLAEADRAFWQAWLQGRTAALGIGELGLTVWVVPPEAAAVLEALGRRPGLSRRRLARRLRLPPSRVRRALERLRRAGFLLPPGSRPACAARAGARRPRRPPASRG